MTPTEQFVKGIPKRSLDHGLKSLFLYLCLVFLFLTGWGHWGPPVKVGFSLDKAEGREVLIKSLKDELGENRADFLLLDAKGDTATQRDQVKDLIAKGSQVLVLVPVNPKNAGSLVQIAHQCGLKVISLERFIPDCALDYLITFDRAKVGELQANSMVKKISRGRYVLLGGNPKDRDFEDFREGQMKVLKPLIDRGDIQIVAVRVCRDPSTPLKAQEEMENILKTQGDRVDAVLASDCETAEGAIHALEKAGLSGKVPVAGIGADLGTCRRIHSGVQFLTVYDPPKKLAAETAFLSAKVGRKATQFDCQFTEIDDGGSKTLVVLKTPLVVDSKNLESTILDDGVQKKNEVYTEN